MECGTHNAYSHGGRCESCREAHRVYVAERRKKALADGTLTHGKRGTFDAGCRCEQCVNARRAAYFTNPSGYGYQRAHRGDA